MQPYVDLLKTVLCDFHRLEAGEYRPYTRLRPNWKARLAMLADRAIGARTRHLRQPLALCERVTPVAETRAVGGDWPAHAETMIGLRRLDNIEFCIDRILADAIPGDFIETGVWRGGASIFMRGVLAARGVTDRTVWLADSFAGLPPPDPAYPADSRDRLHTVRELAVPLDVVQRNFAKYGLLDEQVRFLKGWFKDTLPAAPIERLALLRLDGDMYGSTMDALVPLYPKLSVGGYVIIDDWLLKACRRAVEDYRREHGIGDTIVDIDGSGVFWRKT